MAGSSVQGELSISNMGKKIVTYEIGFSLISDKVSTTTNGSSIGSYQKTASSSVDNLEETYTKATKSAFKEEEEVEFPIEIWIKGVSFDGVITMRFN